MAEKKKAQHEDAQEDAQEQAQQQEAEDFFANMDKRLHRYGQEIARLAEQHQMLRTDWLNFNRDANHQMNHMSQRVKQNMPRKQPEAKPEQQKGG